MDSDLTEHMIPHQVPRLARPNMLLVMGIRQSHATNVLVYFYLNPVIPTISCRTVALPY